MEALELFFATYEKTALAFFSFTGFIGVVSAVIYRFTVVVNAKKAKKRKYNQCLNDKFKAIDIAIERLEQKFLDEHKRQNKQSDFAKDLHREVLLTKGIAYNAKGCVDTIIKALKSKS